MKLTMEEKQKHRVVGVVVILSIAAIFLPAMMKKSSQRFDKKVATAVVLPTKPPAPKVTILKKKEIFKAPLPLAKAPLPVAVKAELPSIKALPFTPKSMIAKAEPLLPRQEKEVPAPKPPIAIAPTKDAFVSSVHKTPPKPIKLQRKPLQGFGVQVATFAQKNNAIALMHVLKNKGFAPLLQTIQAKNKVTYKIVVGPMKERKKARELQQKLATALHINGFIVPTKGVFS